jgi:hypothetical protein
MVRAGLARVIFAVIIRVQRGHYRHLRPDPVGTDGDGHASKPGMDDDVEREAIRAEGLDPDDPTVVTAIDLVRCELSSLWAMPTWTTTPGDPNTQMFADDRFGVVAVAARWRPDPSRTNRSCRGRHRTTLPPMGAPMTSARSTPRTKRVPGHANRGQRGTT